MPEDLSECSPIPFKLPSLDKRSTPIRSSDASPLPVTEVENQKSSENLKQDNEETILKMMNIKIKSLSPPEGSYTSDSDLKNCRTTPMDN